MKKMIITHLLILCSMAISGQRNLNGIYVSEWRNKIEINGNAFKYITTDNLEGPLFYNDTLANCSIKWINNQFIELNSSPPYLIILKGLKVVQSTDTILANSLKIVFSIPYHRSNLEISVSTNNFKIYDLVYSEHNKQLILPIGVKSFSFSLSPGEYLPMHSIEGLHYGILYYLSIEYPIEKNANRIDIEIPAIDDSFFEKYYVKGEYAKVSGDTITWKGETFIKNL